jgi:hypothetical protein
VEVIPTAKGTALYVVMFIQDVYYEIEDALFCKSPTLIILGWSGGKGRVAYPRSVVQYLKIGAALSFALGKLLYKQMAAKAIFYPSEGVICGKKVDGLRIRRIYNPMRGKIGIKASASPIKLRRDFKGRNRLVGGDGVYPIGISLPRRVIDDPVNDVYNIPALGVGKEKGDLFSGGSVQRSFGKIIPLPCVAPSSSVSGGVYV